RGGPQKKHFARVRAQPLEKARFGRENPRKSKQIQTSGDRRFAAPAPRSAEIQGNPNVSRRSERGAWTRPFAWLGAGSSRRVASGAPLLRTGRPEHFGRSPRPPP